MKRGFLCLVFIVSQFSLRGLEIFLSPVTLLVEEPSMELSADERRFNETFFEAVRSADARNALRTSYLDPGRLPKDGTVRSTMDAVDVCETYKIDYLVYGYYQKGYKTIEAEIRIFDRERREVRKTFYAKAETDELDLVRDDLAERFVMYMYSIVGIEVRKEIPRMFRGFGGWELSVGAGYWMPVGDWFDVYTGVAKFNIGLFIQPEVELFWLDDFLFMYRFGIFLEYRLGVSRPDIETSTLHSAKVALPLHCFVLFLERHAVYAGIALYYQHDFINQFSVYGPSNWLNSGTFGSGICVGYEYWMGERREYSFGVELTTDIDFYEHVWVEPALNVKFKYRFPFQAVTDGEEKTE